MGVQDMTLFGRQWRLKREEVMQSIERVSTYEYVLVLACGHRTRMTRNAKNRGKLPRSQVCFHCSPPGSSGVVEP
jgi:hypothetical protein